MLYPSLSTSLTGALRSEVFMASSNSCDEKTTKEDNLLSRNLIDQSQDFVA